MPMNFLRAFGSTAIYTRYKVISSRGQFKEVPPVPDFTDSIPSFFRALIIFRIVTGLQPVESASSSLVTHVSSPNRDQIRPVMAMGTFGCDTHGAVLRFKKPVSWILQKMCPDMTIILAVGRGRRKLRHLKLCRNTLKLY